MKARRLVLPAIMVVAGCHLIGGAGDYIIGDESHGGGGTGAAGAAGGGGGSAGSGGCSAVAEVCLNGADDDCDDAVDCDDSDCSEFSCQSLPAGATWVFEPSGGDPCPVGFTGLELDDCDCVCDVDAVGTCTFVALHYDNATCSGTPIEEITVPSVGCAPSTAVAAGGETIGVIAEQIGLGDAQCSPQSPSGAIANVALCALAASGACTGGDACVPPAAGEACVLFDGDVTCPQPYLEKRLVHEASGADSCDCSCAGGEQTCDPTKHTHAWIEADCTGAKTDTRPDRGCNDTQQMSVGSVDNHDEPLAATGAECENTSAPRTQPAARTLCCVMR